MEKKHSEKEKKFGFTKYCVCGCRYNSGSEELVVEKTNNNFKMKIVSPV